MDSVNILEVKNIKKSFSGVCVLKDINISFRQGECHALCGENGAGKSTLMKIIAGAYTRDEGSILLNGVPVNVHSTLEAQQIGISIIYQELSLIPMLSAGENVFLGRLPKKKNRLVNWKEVHKRASQYFKQLNLDIDSRVKARTLSVAQQQLVEISRALSVNSKVVIMDEPTSSLSQKETDILFDIIRDFKKKGITVIYISHKLDEIFEICDRVTVLKDGVMTGTKNVTETTKEEVISLMVGRELSQYYPKRDYISNDEVVFEAQNLCAGRLVNDVSFQVHRGEILGFAGLVGAGRTETVRAIFGADKLTSGKMYVCGKEVKNGSTKKAIKNGIALATEDRRSEGLIMTLSVRENTTMANYKSFSNGLAVINHRKEKEITLDYVEKMNTKTTGTEQRVINLSGGNQQKVVISKWLNTGAKLFIFDEPTRGVDVGAKAEIYQHIVDLADEGHGIIIISSELPEVLGISDRIAVMHDGKITGFLGREEASEDKVMRLALLGGEAG